MGHAFELLMRTLQDLSGWQGKTGRFKELSGLILQSQQQLGEWNCINLRYLQQKKCHELPVRVCTSGVHLGSPIREAVNIATGTSCIWTHWGDHNLMCCIKQNTGVELHASRCSFTIVCVSLKTLVQARPNVPQTCHLVSLYPTSVYMTTVCDPQCVST